YDCPDSYRIWDYHGTFWSLDSYDFWTLSSDVGMCCYVYDEGAWHKGWQIDHGTDVWTVTIDSTTTTKAAAALGLLGEYKLIMGIPLSVSGKSPFFDREKP
ncbi:MAG: ferredoxin domain-containing protein, partial [Firmicutes bacterium]|nr:ferredoxin domain-containing protein [Bacillota bacterium]